MTCEFFLENETVDSEPANICVVLRDMFPARCKSMWIPSHTYYCRGRSDECPIKKLKIFESFRKIIDKEKELREVG